MNKLFASVSLTNAQMIAVKGGNKVDMVDDPEILKVDLVDDPE